MNTASNLRFHNLISLIVKLLKFISYLLFLPCFSVLYEPCKMAFSQLEINDYTKLREIPRKTAVFSLYLSFNGRRYFMFIFIITDIYPRRNSHRFFVITHNIPPESKDDSMRYRYPARILEIYPPCTIK